MSDTEYKSSHKLSWFGGTILIFIAVVADVIDWFEVGLPITDVVMGGVDVILLDENSEGGQGVVPYLPLNELNRTTNTGGSN